ncbi:hypothetical protein H112_07029 [Trichophyton rubrum D6]|uniref:Uncharacterized protein n=3 Tax=Trichophyton rubrum TaxID=5551 RepID=A0A178F1S7_TRIRU|nr:uncharacterized protein TERG_02372 [Trichophyton rubrum CBS 118892]EZF11969.1 hypothetical protein H100_07052 [Trichophyton rubrum MR850]EZF38830.1 hypothetical protein H102_07015 [Trichophyton rubrum CBS 100081]EZF49462.1 hypothetical protein H103_07037 [Trichophyton rubrum CBS 288.86]EZF60070.1 hypothetical protein H104_06992 [Trichophyton rubrum CBS 289.86]EZF81473.1 hypothetical protein H110_07033 [Trichophyton rubrum MR1448]EZF92031.1 hypothetical protein H113_07088 [Trichophyton rubr
MAQLEVPKQRSSGSPKKKADYSKEFPSFSSSFSSSTSSSSLDIPIIFSVFYGRPQRGLTSHSTSSTPSHPLKHVSFESKVNASFIEHARKKTEEPRGRIWERRKHRRDCDSIQFKEIATLASTHQDQILELWGSKHCAVCDNQPATAVLYLPICCTYDGYYTLADGDRLFWLMLSIAKLVADLDSDVKVRSAIGSNVHMPYINGLAVPVCSAEDTCRKEANLEVARFLKAFGFDDTPAPEEAKADDNDYDSEERVRDEQNRSVGPLLHRRSTCSSKFATDMAMFRDAIEADEWEDDDVTDSGDEAVQSEPPVPSIPGHSPTRMHLHERVPLRYTVLCGQPILNRSPGATATEVDAGRLTCLVFTSRWEAGLLESVANASHDPEPYQMIASFHERFIMASAEFRCCICPKRVLATTLVHCPISFRRDAENSPCNQPHRQSMIRLLQYTKGKWNYPETKAALGYDGVWHIDDFVVPICHGGSVCEETARIAAAQFIDGILATGDKRCYTGLMPDTDLLGAFWVENGGKIPKLVVERIGLGLFTDSRSRRSPGAEVILKNKQAIEAIRRSVKAKRESISSPEGSVAFVPNDNNNIGNDNCPRPPEKSNEELIQDGGKTYTYSLEDEDAMCFAEAEEGGIPTWGGYPLSEESAKLVDAGLHESALMKPIITMEVLKTLETTKEFIKGRYSLQEGEDEADDEVEEVDSMTDKMNS